MARDLGFTYTRHRNEIHIYHNGKKATILRGTRARKFEEEFISCDIESQQKLMARITGNYKRGNENQAKNHPRNK